MTNESKPAQVAPEQRIRELWQERQDLADRLRQTEAERDRYHEQKCAAHEALRRCVEALEGLYDDGWLTEAGLHLEGCTDDAICHCPWPVQVRTALAEARRLLEPQPAPAPKCTGPALLTPVSDDEYAKLDTPSEEEMLKACGTCTRRVESLGGPWCADGHYLGEKEEREWLLSQRLERTACPDWKERTR